MLRQGDDEDDGDKKLEEDTTGESPNTGLRLLASQNPRLLEKVIGTERRVRRQHLWRQAQLIVDAAAVTGDASKDLADAERFYSEEPIPWVAIGAIFASTMVYMQVSRMGSEYRWLVPVVNCIMLLTVFGAMANFLRK